MEHSMVMFTVSELKIMTAKHLLREAGIEAHTINKKDSAHAGIFGGTIDLYVAEEFKVKAKEILIKEEIIQA